WWAIWPGQPFGSPRQPAAPCRGGMSRSQYPYPESPMFAQLLRAVVRPFTGTPKSSPRAGVRLELELLESPQTPTVQTSHVTSNSDSATDPNSLRALLTKANSWMWMNDSFVIKVDVSAINITQALPGLYRNIEIDGNSVTITRTGSDAYRIFEVGVERT